MTQKELEQLREAVVPSESWVLAQLKKTKPTARAKERQKTILQRRQP
jgi:cob(I)alamin adenosyltransferase